MHLNSFSAATRYSFRFYFFIFSSFSGPKPILMSCLTDSIYFTPKPLQVLILAFSCKWVQLEILFQYGNRCAVFFFFFKGKSWWDKYLCEINRHLSCLWCLIVYIVGINLFSSTTELFQSNNQMKDIKIVISFPKRVIHIKSWGYR